MLLFNEEKKKERQLKNEIIRHKYSKLMKNKFF